MTTWGSSSLWGLLSTWGEVQAGAEFGCETAKSGLLAQSRGGDFASWICAFASEAGAQLDGVSDIAAAFALDTAVGVQLDVLGSLLGLPRSGFPDDRYRTFLLIQSEIVSGRATGSTSSVLEICRRFIGPASGDPIVAKTSPPYAFTLTVPDVATLLEVQLLASFVARVLWIGVLGYLEFVPAPNSVWASASVAVPSAGVWASASVAVPSAAAWSYVITVGD